MEILHANHAEPGDKNDQPAARLKVSYHSRVCQRKDHARQIVKKQEDSQLRQRDQRNHYSQRAGKDQGSRKVKDRFGEEDALVAVHPGNNRPVDSGTAGAEQHDRRHQSFVEFFPGKSLRGGNEPAHSSLHPLPRRIDLLSKMDHKPDTGSEDDSKNNCRHILHFDNRGDTHTHRTAPEHHIQFLLKRLSEPASHGSSKKSPDHN